MGEEARQPMSVGSLHVEDARGHGVADVALVIADLGGGGAQRVATTLAGAWSEEGRGVTLITLSGADGDVVPVPPAVRRVALGLVCASGSLLGGLIANLRRIGALRRAIIESGATVVIGFVGATNVITILAGIGLGKRIVVSERNDPTRQSLGPVWDLLRRLCYPLASQVTANSRGTLRALAAYVPEVKLALTPNPVLAPNVDPAPHGNGRFMLAVGRLHPQKGFDVLLRALAKSGAQQHGWRLKVLGNGPLRQALHDQADEFGVAKLVDWVGYAPDPYPSYASADAFVLPSRYEGMPNALLEAMAMGLPVIVTDACPGPLEYVEHGVSGMVVPVEDPGALARAMDRIMGDGDLAKRLGSEGRRRVLADTALPRVMAAWNRVLGEGRVTAHEATAP